MGVKLKILYIANRINSPDGSSVHCRAFVNGVKKLGHEIVTCPAISEIDYSKPKKIPNSEKNIRYYLTRINFKIIKSYLHRSNAYVSEYLSLFESFFESTRKHRELMRILSWYKADVLIFRNHGFNIGPFWTGKVTGIPIVLEINSLRSLENRLRRHWAVAKWPTNWAENFAITSADAIFTVSKPILNKIQPLADGKPLCVVENGVDCEQFNPLNYSKNEAKKKLGLENKTVIGYVGSFMPWHDLDTTIETLSILRGIDLNYHLVLIGNGVDYERIKKKVAAKRLMEAVTFTGGVPHKEISQFLAAFDVALMSYPCIGDFYFSPLKLFEYLAMGVTVVATNIGQIGEIITHGKNGILVDNPTPENFAKAIKIGTRNQKKISIQARNLVSESYSWVRNAEKIIELVQRVIDQKKGLNSVKKRIYTLSGNNM